MDCNRTEMAVRLKTEVLLRYQTNMKTHKEPTSTVVSMHKTKFARQRDKCQPNHLQPNSEHPARTLKRKRHANRLFTTERNRASVAMVS